MITDQFDSNNDKEKSGGGTVLRQVIAKYIVVFCEMPFPLV